MISRLNFTSRRKISKRLIAINLVEGDPPRFDAALHLDDVGFPSGAEVVVEATRTGAPAVQRFYFGTIGAIEAPENRTLDEIAGEHIKFAVKVIDRREQVGRLLGLADGIRPSREGAGSGERRAILPVKPEDLGERLWRLCFDETDVYLEVNNAIPEIKSMISHDVRVTSLIYPEIVRQILERVVIVDGYTELQDDDDDWRDLWLRFGVGCHPEREHPPAVEDMSDASRADFDHWVDEVVDEFCRTHRLKTSFIQLLEREESA